MDTLTSRSIRAWLTAMLFILTPITALSAPKYPPRELALARDYVLAACVMDRYAGTPLAVEADAWAGGLDERGRLDAAAYPALAKLGRQAPSPGITQNGASMRLQSCIDFINAKDFPGRLQSALRVKGR